MESAAQSDTNLSEEIINLIREGKSEKVIEILEVSFFYHTAGTSGSTLLHYSVQYNNEKLTQYLLNKGCNVDVQNSMWITPLMIAVMNNKKALMKILLQAGADILKLNNEKKSVLHVLATQYKMKLKTILMILQELQRKCPTSEEIAKKLVDAGCHLYQAVPLKDARIIEYMIKKGTPVNYVRPKYEITALHAAAFVDDLESVKVLLKYGAHVNALDAKKENPLSKLYKDIEEHSREKIEILKVLIDHGATMTSCSSTGVFHVHLILTKGNREAVRILLESGLDFNVEDYHHSKKALHYLAINLNPGITEELKCYIKNIDVNVRDRRGPTPLLYAVREGNVEMVKFLLLHDANTEISHRYIETTPLYYAYRHSRPGRKIQYRQCGEMLLQSNANPQFVAYNGNAAVTIFDAALRKNDYNRIKPVLAHLALIEKLGTLITEASWAKINAHDKLKNYFDECQKLLFTERVYERLLFDLLNCYKRKMAKYLRNKYFAEEMNNGSYKRRMKDYSYYCSILERRYSHGIRYKKLEDEAARVICRIFQNYVDEKHIIVNMIIDYLDNKSLRRLCRSLVENDEDLRLGIINYSE